MILVSTTKFCAHQKPSSVSHRSFPDFGPRQLVRFSRLLLMERQLLLLLLLLQKLLLTSAILFSLAK